MCVHPLLWLLFGFNIKQIKPRFHHPLWHDWEIHCHLCGITLKRSKPKPFSAFCVHPWAFAEPILPKTYDSLA
jgi:hypothetical protein